jgi:Uncharacterized membrane-anchored protein conserved in bacteria
MEEGDMLALARFFLVTILVVASTSVSHAKTYKELFPDRVYRSTDTQSFVESLNYQQGAVTIERADVQLTVPPDFYFLGVADARRVLVDQWRNPPAAANNVLGMIFSAAATPADDTWGAVISFDADGYVSDQDAAKIDYAELLRSMQSSTEEVNKDRVQQGFPTIRLVGWASTPFYDAATHKLHWAKELEFSDSPKHTLNYDVRALGRKGVLKINFVADMDQLAMIRGVIPTVMGMPEFEQGSRYQDYVPSVDKVAAYGIGGLIAGKALAKVGVFALALAFLKKGWILVLLAAGGLLRGLKRFFGGGSKADV